MSEKLIIIDGNAIIHRSFHAIPTSLQTKDGLLTNAAYGFAAFLIKALSDIKPQYAVLTLDRKEATFRHEKYKEYKATRVKAPQELYDQIPMAKEIASAFDIPIFELAGFEADDLIGTISKKINEKNPKIEVIIITGDMDTLQLVNEKTKVYTMSKGLSESILYNEEKVLERYSLRPEQIVDFKALKGDASDNIPGVSGIGEKTATDLLIEFENLDNIYKNIKSPKIKERTRELLIRDKEVAYLSQELATIEINAPINLDVEKLRITNLDKNKINQVFSKLEFKSLLSRVLNLNFIKNKDKMSSEIGEDGLIQKTENKFERNKKDLKYKLINNEKNFKSFIDKIKKEKTFAIDTETDSLDPLKANLLGLSFSWKKNEAYFISLRLKNKNNLLIEKTKTPSLFDNDKNKISTENSNPWLKELKKIIENQETEKIGHNLKYDLQILLNYNIEIKGKIFDTMIASYLINPENRQHGLDSLSFSELNWEKISSDDLLKDSPYNHAATGISEKTNKKEKMSFEQVDIEKLSLYSCEDADCTFKLGEIFKKRLKEEKLEKVFKEIEIPLIKILANMERNGITLDFNFLGKLGKYLDSEIKNTKEKIFKEAKTEFNINSPKQLKEILYEKMNLDSKGIKKTKTGLSTAAEELEKIKNLSPIVPLIQYYRELSKLSSTYVESLPKLINKNTGRIHTSFNQTITATGRLSSSDPNLQNIPTRTDLGQKIRQAFVSPAGSKLLSIDYSQIELRVMAHLSGDKKLIEAFKNDQDIHRATAASINNLPVDKIDSKLRHQAKAINFGILYGQGPHGLSQNAGISYQEARNFIEKYFQVYSGVKKYTEKIIEDAKKKGYTETMAGRKRSIPEINSSEIMKKKAAERMAINSPIQGAAADILKMAMIKIYSEIKDKQDIKMLLQVHDELIFEIKEEKINDYYLQIKEIMENIVELKVPLTAEAYIGNNWGQMEKIKKAS
ncbi:DNA polymerase I [Candidatus Falkowbacteria bacterium HGW-Falkowbacteria-1]|uniref:DNA polymerase I n=1 Tax=Candidatus Falkowbacteria bacterium HGW-Falkowbacteria-1 TaxID=2013768 RepID=A0A2N2E8L8_9BACT|nr:MAG: DNA polymerase I [Candidatus Falkowbacteria bacterium HGW-Falkowbacteria-1]